MNDGIEFPITAMDRLLALRWTMASHTRNLNQLRVVTRDRLESNSSQVAFDMALGDLAAMFAEALDGERTGESLAAAIAEWTVRADAEAAAG